MARYGRKAAEKIKCRRQAIAIGLSQARRSCANLPRN